VIHTCNPSYSKGKDQKDHCSRPAWTKSWQDSISIKKPSVVLQACGSSYAGEYRLENSFLSQIQQKWNDHYYVSEK
jgi:hypothetical protein